MIDIEEVIEEIGSAVGLVVDSNHNPELLSVHSLSGTRLVKGKDGKTYFVVDNDVLNYVLDSDSYAGVTLDNKPCVKGEFVFDLKASHGFPLDFALAIIIDQKGYMVSWPGFVQEALKNNWYGYQIYEAIEHALVEAQINKALTQNILSGLREYMWYNCPGFPGYDNREREKKDE